MKSISPVELNRLLATDGSAAVIDVRTPLEYGAVHVTQARNVPLDTLNPKALVDEGTAPSDKPVYILCKSGQRATKAAEKFASQGYSHAVVVEGGTDGWVNASLPVTRGSQNVISLERQVRIGAGSLVLTGVLLGWFVHPYFFGLSGFVGAGLIFAGVTDWCGMGLLIAKAPWNQRTAA
ncbi:MAG: rhodanese-like domain-containing protein [Verrucomicrobium sp.]|nr:rhodanese-like domain-containing protein [Verrucomicrobium sp.]